MKGKKSSWELKDTFIHKIYFVHILVLNNYSSSSMYFFYVFLDMFNIMWDLSITCKFKIWHT